MHQLPIFVTLTGRAVILIGTGEAAEAKRRLIERAGGQVVSDEQGDAVLAFVALADDEAADNAAATIAARLKARGLLVNVVDRPDLCDFTTPAIIDRDPVLVAIGTGGASAGLAKALRQRLEQLLPSDLGALASALHAARKAIRARWANAGDRRRAIDAALDTSGMLDPLQDQSAQAVASWLDGADEQPSGRTEIITLVSTDAEDLTLRTARLLGQADHVWHSTDVPTSILDRARADAVRRIGTPQAGPSAPAAEGLTIVIQLAPRAL